MKRITGILVTCLLMVGVLSGCITATDSVNFGSVKKVTLRLAHIYAAEHPFTVALDEFCGAVLEKSDGKLKIQHFSAAQLGDEPSIHEGLKNGTIQMAVMGISEAGKDYHPILVYEAPFLFTDAEQMMAANTNDIGRQLWTNFAEATGITMLCPMYYGTRQLTTNKQVSTVDALSRLKIRVPSQKNSVEVWTALGATPTPMNLSEVYLSLQTGVVDGQENPVATIMSQGFDEVCSYMNMTSHQVQNCPLFIVSDALEGLDPLLKAVLMECVEEYIVSVTDTMIEYEETMVKEIADSGQMTVNYDVDRESFRAALQDYIASNEETWGEGIYEQLSNTTY